MIFINSKSLSFFIQNLIILNIRGKYKNAWYSLRSRKVNDIFQFFSYVRVYFSFFLYLFVFSCIITEDDDTWKM